MKIKYFLIVFLLSSFILQAQKNSNNFYKVTIFKTLEEKSVSLKIDSLGNIFKNNIATNLKVDIKAFNNSIHRLVNQDKDVEKVEGSNDPPKSSSKPEKNKQNLYLTIIFLKDFYNEQNLGTMTNYSIRIEDIDESVKNYSWFKYISKKDLSIIKTLFE
jgi:hypothetical protein